MRMYNIAGSSNGKTTDFGSVYLGSSPSPAAVYDDTNSLSFLKNNGEIMGNNGVRSLS